MIKADKYYLENLSSILDEMNSDENVRPRYADGTEAKSYFITQVVEKYSLSNGEYPIPTLRNTATKTGIREILWIYQKQSNSLEMAKEMGIHWWNDWDIGDGTIGNRYGYTVKKHDLMNKLLKGLEENPFGRRHVINMLQEEDLRSSDGLYPCAFETLYSVRKKDGVYYIDMTLNQRSNDYIMAGFINKIQYVSLLMMICGHLRSKTKLNYQPGNFTHFVQNLHIYDRHIDAAKEILDRNPIEVQPILKLKEDKDFYSYAINDFEIVKPDGIERIKSELELAI